MFKNLERQLARWLELLQQYDFEVRHRGGKSHGNADVLLRRPCEESSCRYCYKIEEKEVTISEREIKRIILEDKAANESGVRRN